jgi:hypothetical protein
MTWKLLPVAIVVALVVGLPAAASPTWGVPVQISVGDRALGPDLALNAAGDALVVWDQEVGPDCATSPASLTCIHIVTAATRARASAAWSTPIEISRPGVGAAPRAAIDPLGNAAIVWVHDIGRDRVLQATYRRGSSSAWPEPSDLSDPSLGVWDHDIVIDAHGNALAVWREAPGIAFACVRSAETGVWGMRVRLSSQETTRGPSVALTESGKAIVAWAEGTKIRVVRGDTRTGAWQIPVEISTGPAEVVDGPYAAINATGVGAVVWIQKAGSTLDVRASTGSSGESWSSPVSLRLQPDADFSAPRVAVDDRGDVVAAWLERGVVQASTRPAGNGTWRGPELVSWPTVRSTRFDLSMNWAGNAVLVMVGGSNDVTRSALMPRASGIWQPASPISGVDTATPAAAVDREGRAVAVWSRETSGRVVVESADLTGAGPMFQDLRIPRRGVVGARLRFSVVPHSWSDEIGDRPSWTFGDGTAARGNRVTHRYSRPGRYVVSVRQRGPRDSTVARARIRITR